MCQPEVPGQTADQDVIKKQSMNLRCTLCLICDLYQQCRSSFKQHYFLVMIDCFLVMIYGVGYMNANTSLYLHSRFFLGCLLDR